MKQFRDTKYFVNESGEVFNHKTQKQIKTQIIKGYSTVGLYFNKKQHTVSMHRMIAECFIPNPNNLPEVNHKDGNKLNNNISNLEWCTRKGNMDHAVETGLHKNHQFGEKCNFAKLSTNDILKIRELFKNGTSKKELSTMFKTDYFNVCHIINKTRWSHV